MTQKPPLWATGDWQLHHNAPAHASHLQESFFGETSNHLGDSVPLQPRFGAPQRLAFSKTKVPLKGKRFQTMNEIQENTTGQLTATGRTV